MATEGTAADVYEYLKHAVTAKKETYALPITLVRRYVGSLDNNSMFHGEGVLFSVTGFCYEGDFVHGSMEGQGRISWSSGITYEGEFYGNAPNGKGIFTWANGDRYVGEVRNGVRHGNGEFFTTRGVYSGTWVSGKRHGTGRQTYVGGSFYMGEWLEDKRNGKGKLVYPGGDVYDGMWKNGQRHGFGVMGWKSGAAHFMELYEGHWISDVPHGSGRSTYVLHLDNDNIPQEVDSPAEFSSSILSVVNVYEGNYEQGKRHGFGVFFYADGGTYEGEWRHGNKEGLGTITTSVGASFHGIFHDNEADELMMKMKSLGPLPSVTVTDFFGISDISSADAIASIQPLLLRYNLTFRTLFDDYCGRHEGVNFISTPSNWWRHRVPGHIFVSQYLRLLNDAHIINGHICITDVIDCVVATIENESETNQQSGDRSKSDRLRVLCQAVLRLDGYLNYRQFVESLLRLSAIASVGFNTTELSQRFAAFVEGFLVKERLANEPLCPLTRRCEAFLAPHLSSLQTLFCQLVSGSLQNESYLSAILPVRSFIAFFRSLFVEYGLDLTETVNHLFPFDRFKTPGIVPTAVCQPRNALGFCMYEKSCGLSGEFTASLVASERRLTFVEFVEAVLDFVRLIGATDEEGMQKKLHEVLLVLRPQVASDV